MTFARLSILGWVLMLPFLCALYLTVPVSPDQALFDYIAWSHIQGDYYYVGAAEQNWPGKMFIHELGIRIFGVHFWTFRAIDFALMQALTLMGVLFLRRVELPVAAGVLLLVYPAIYITAGGWMAGQRDIIAMGFLLAAAALTLPSRKPSEWRLGWFLLAGVLVFCAVILRPTFLTFLAVLMLVELALFLTGKDRFLTASAKAFAMPLGFFVALGLVVWAGNQIGALDDFYQQTILFNIESYQVAQSRLRLFEPMLFLISNSWHWVAALAAIGAVMWLYSSAFTHGFVLLLGLVATILISYFVQNKGFGYHLGGLLLLFSVLIGVAFDRAILAWRKSKLLAFHFLAASVTIAMALLVVAGTAKKILNTMPADNIAVFAPNYNNPDALDWAEMSKIVAIIKETTSPDDFVLQWGRDFQLPYLAERRSTTRFVSTPALYVMTPAFSGYEDWLAELERDLVAKRPAIVLLPPDVMNRLQNSEPSEIAAEQILLSQLVGYETVLETDHISVLRAP